MKFSKKNSRPLSPKQRQAVVVCSVCALVLVLTIGITSVLVTKQIHAVRGPDDELPDIIEESSYQIESSTVLPENPSKDESYLKETLFIGDSNTVRLYKNGLIPLQQFCAQEGLTIQQASKQEIVGFKKDSKMYTIADAVAKMKPRRVLITLGTNNASSTTKEEDFIASYRTLIEKIKKSYPHTDIIINTIPPVPEDHSNYPAIEQEVIDKFNLALADLCEEMEVHLLNSAQVLKGEDGFGRNEYYNKKDIHLTLSGLKAMLKYYTTHALVTEDRRPDTKGIPERSADSAKPVEDKPSKPQETAFTAEYNTQTSGGGAGGTLTGNGESGKSSLKVNISNGNTSVTVKAVPANGYVFVKWSDGVTTAARTDKKFTQNLNVTAMFAPLSLSINAESTAVTVGDTVKLHAKLSSSKYASTSNIVWYMNQSQIGSGSSCQFTASAAQTVEVYAEVSYNGQTVRSNTVTVKIAPPKPDNNGGNTSAGSDNNGGNTSTGSDNNGGKPSTGANGNGEKPSTKPEDNEEKPSAGPEDNGEKPSAGPNDNGETPSVGPEDNGEKPSEGGDKNPDAQSGESQNG